MLINWLRSLSYLRCGVCVVVMAATVALTGCGSQHTTTTLTVTTSTAPPTTAPATTAAPTTATTAPPTTPTSPTSAVRFGISNDYLLQATSADGTLFHNSVLGQNGLVRVFAPYDVYGSWNGQTCTTSPAYQAGGVAWASLISSLTMIHSLGLDAEIVFSSGTGLGGVPANPDPSSAVQAEDYSCGIRLALQALWQGAQLPGATITMPTEYEAWNEPDIDGYSHNWDGSAGSCPQPAALTPSCSGPWQAAMFWYLAQTQANYLSRTVSSFSTVTIAALTMSAPEKSYFLDANHLNLSSPNGQLYNGYYQSLYQIIHCHTGFGGCTDPTDNPQQLPSVWAVHDYADPSAGGTQDLNYFEAQLAQLNDRWDHGASAAIWITESGVHLDSSFQSDRNDPQGVHCAAQGSASANSFGCLVNGNPNSQARGARAWLDLAHQTAPTQHGSVSVTELFWYQFEIGTLTCTSTAPCLLGNGKVDGQNQTLPDLHSWDSALLDNTGDGRSSFCVITNQPLSQCTGRSDAYADAHWENWWQTSAMPETCPAHDGAWIADSSGSGVPGGQICDYSTNIPPA